jgi:predicted alpha/beta-fold hydrolase
VVGWVIPAGIILAYVLYYVKVAVKPTRLYYNPDSPHKELLKECPSLKQYYPSMVFVNGHTQTFGVKLFRTAPKLLYEREYVPLEDGGAIALDWDSEMLSCDESVPTILVMHGLVGSSTSKYIRNLVSTLKQRGWRPVVFNARGMGTSELRSPSTFIASRTSDLRQAVKFIKQKFPNSPLLAAAYSMGANILTKYLAEEKENSVILGAVSISNPFDLCTLSDSAKWSRSGVVYGTILTWDLQAYLKRHRHVLKDTIDWEHAIKSKNLWDYDHRVTLPVAKEFSSIEEYYKQASCVFSLDDVKVPVLFLHSMDDPIVPGKHIEYVFQSANKNPNLIFAVTERGGHTAFLKNFVWWKKAWSDDVIEEFLNAMIRNHEPMDNDQDTTPLLAT